jgi:hypothetical protein
MEVPELSQTKQQLVICYQQAPATQQAMWRFLSRRESKWYAPTRWTVVMILNKRLLCLPTSPDTRNLIFWIQNDVANSQFTVSPVAACLCSVRDTHPFLTNNTCNWIQWSLIPIIRVFVKCFVIIVLKVNAIPGKPISCCHWNELQYIRHLYKFCTHLLPPLYLSAAKHAVTYPIRNLY